jgi:crossover junction endodeoxyribonuclease RuvC
MERKERKIVIGIDPGTRVTGYGIIEVLANGFKPLDFGCIRPPVKYSLSDRYSIIFDSLQELLERYNPLEMALETQFVNKNAQSALKLGIAMGCALLAAKSRKMRVFGYSPREVKCFIAGTGKAGKEQLQYAVTRFLSLKTLPEPQDAADALAIALCHATWPTSTFSSKRTNKEM